MSREYVVSGGGQTLANQAVTLVFINPGTTASIEILRAWVSQSGSTTSAQQRVQFNTQVTAFPTLVSATPAKLKISDPASVITGGTAMMPGMVELGEDIFLKPVRVGVPEYRGNLHEVVKSPRYATVMGLLQEGRVQRMRGRKVVVQSGSAKQIWTRMKEWFIGNF